MNKKTIVVDVGARYGAHPTWNKFNADMKYIMFEPDAIEAERLRKRLNKDIFEVFETALDYNEGSREFYLLKHRGLSSFLKPDPSSECFRTLKKGQANIEKIISIKTRAIDSFMEENEIEVDFLKVDTEGSEHEVILGASKQLEKNVLGVRSSCNFQPCFIGQKLFSDTHDYLMKKNFILLNIDYSGYGYPRLGLFRKPEPIEAENYRYGVLVAADAVWIKRPEVISQNYSEDKDAHDFAILKLAAFCMFNNAPDVGVDILREHVLRENYEGMSSTTKESNLYHLVKYEMTNFLGRWRTVPDEQWNHVSSIYNHIFNEPLEGGSEFYPQLHRMQKKLAPSFHLDV